MVKHYCDKCGIELANAERCRISVSISGALSCSSANLEYCPECVSTAFGEEFTAKIKADSEERKRRIAERKAEREKAKADADHVV